MEDKKELPHKDIINGLRDESEVLKKENAELKAKVEAGHDDTVVAEVIYGLHSRMELHASGTVAMKHLAVIIKDHIASFGPEKTLKRLMIDF